MDPLALLKESSKNASRSRLIRRFCCTRYVRLEMVPLKEKRFQKLWNCWQVQLGLRNNKQVVAVSAVLKNIGWETVPGCNVIRNTNSCWICGAKGLLNGSWVQNNIGAATTDINEVKCKQFHNNKQSLHRSYSHKKIPITQMSLLGRISITSKHNTHLPMWPNRHDKPSTAN